MKIWIVAQEYEESGDYFQFIEGVFSTQEKAEAAIKLYQEDNKTADYLIIDREVDAPWGVTV